MGACAVELCVCAQGIEQCAQTPAVETSCRPARCSIRCSPESSTRAIVTRAVAASFASSRGSSTMRTNKVHPPLFWSGELIQPMPREREAPMKDIRAAAVQFEHAPSDKAANWRTIEQLRPASRTARRRHPRLSRMLHHRLLAPAQALPRRPGRPGRARLRRPLLAAPQRPRPTDRHHHRRRPGRDRRTDGTLYNTYVVAMPDGQLAAPPQAALLYQRAHGLRLRIHRL